MNEYLLMHEDCRVVRGYQHTVIYDLNRPENSNLIPDSLADFIQRCSKETLNAVYAKHKGEELEIAKEYVEFLLENEFAFMADEHVKKHIAKLPMTIERPELVYNSIVCVDESNVNTINQTMEQLDNLLCINIEFRCKALSLEGLSCLLDSFKNSMLETVIIRIEHADYLTEKFLNDLLNTRPRVKEISIYNSPKSKDIGAINFVAKPVDYYQDCGYINQATFMINQPFFTEGQTCNTCLNKKLSVDFEGNIKSCPSAKKKFGNVKNTQLSTIIDNAELKEQWNTTKDQIEVCKDCENRYMCLDCRVFTDSSARKNARPSRCNYNPYIGKWKGEEGYKTLEECGVISNEKKFKIDHKKIAAINKELWGED